MKLTGKMRVNTLMGTALLSSLMILSTTESARADWIQDLMDPACNPGIANDMAADIRQNIENSVKRAEAAIQAAIPTADLSCLNDLMNAPLDIFSNIGGIMGNLQAGFSGAISGAVDAAGAEVSRQVCQFAQDKWNQLTEPLTGGLDELSVPSIADAFSAEDSEGNSYFNNPTAPANSESDLAVTPVEGDPIVPSDEDGGDAGVEGEDDVVTQVQTLQQALQCYAQASDEDRNGFAIGNTFEERLAACLEARGITDLTDVLGYTESAPALRAAAAPAAEAAPTPVSPAAQAFLPENNPGATPAAPAPAAPVSTETQIWNMMSGGAAAPSN